MSNEKIKNSLTTKKRKLSMESNENLKKKILWAHQDSKNIPRIFPVLKNEYFRPVEKEKMIVGKINVKKETSRLIKELSSHWPIGNHLKRVRRTQQKDLFEILIRPVLEDECIHNFSISSIFGETIINKTGLMDSLTVLDVPKFPVLTHQQYKEAKEYWPVQFREDKNIEKVLEDSFFSTDEKKEIAKFIKLSLDAAQYGDDKVGCVVVDPVTSETIAIAHDRRSSHPIQHSVMVAVELVSKSQGGGAWNIDSEHVYHKPFIKEEMENKIAEIKKSHSDKDTKKFLPYLCTGYDAYISREPCVMCAMALVHSRIRRVFYAHRSPHGALGSQFKLHLQDGLNHHYEVFRVEITEAAENCKQSKISEDSTYCNLVS